MRRWLVFYNSSSTACVVVAVMVEKMGLLHIRDSKPEWSQDSDAKAGLSRLQALTLSPTV